MQRILAAGPFWRAKDEARSKGSHGRGTAVGAARRVVGVVGGHSTGDAGQPQPRHRAGAAGPQGAPCLGAPLSRCRQAGRRHPGRGRHRVPWTARRGLHRRLLLARMSRPLLAAADERRVLGRQDHGEPGARYAGRPPARGCRMDGRPGLGARGSAAGGGADPGRPRGRTGRVRPRRRYTGSGRSSSTAAPGSSASFAGSASSRSSWNSPPVGPPRYVTSAEMV